MKKKKERIIQIKNRSFQSGMVVLVGSIIYIIVCLILTNFSRREIDHTLFITLFFTIGVVNFMAFGICKIYLAKIEKDQE